MMLLILSAREILAEKANLPHYYFRFKTAKHTEQVTAEEMTGFFHQCKAKIQFSLVFGVDFTLINLSNKIFFRGNRPSAQEMRDF